MSKPTKRAAIYLRVSSRGQVNTDYDPEGLSLPAQRNECTRKGASLDAVVVREYVEPGVSAKSLTKRKAFQQMLKDIQEFHDIDYVIVWSVSRWARNQEDYWVARGLINRAGAKLISVKEPIGDDTSYGVTVEGVMAAVAAGRRLEIAEEVMQGITRKLEVGGTPNRARLGYLNVREPLPQGGEVRTVVLDPERAPIIRWGFETYATGLYSENDMVTLLAARGLKTRGTRRYPSQAVSHSTVHDMLSSSYYAGIVTYQGKQYKGRHEPLISMELFEQVQAVLQAHAQSGDRDQQHSHYLKGSIRCARCDHRLTYSQNTGNGGTYEYFICISHQRGDCEQSAQRVEAVEASIEDHYRTIALSADERDRVAAAIERHLAKLASTSQSELSRCEQVLIELKTQEKKLLAKHYQDDISDELYKEEADRIKRERKAADAIIARLSLRHDELQAGLTLALTLASSDLHDLYLRASSTVRRLMNQAIFETIWVWDETEVRSQLASPFKELVAIRDATQQRTEARSTSHAESTELMTWSESWTAQDDEASDTAEASEALVVGLNDEVMVGDTGLEPVTSALSRRRSPS